MPATIARILAVAVSTCLVFLAQTPPAIAESLRVGGTGTATELLKVLGRAFTRHTGVDVEVVPSLGSTGAIRAVADGALGFAVSGRGLTRDEVDSGMSIAVTARTPFVFATSHPAPNALRSSQIAEVYSAIKATWSDGSALLIILRPRSESDTTLMGELFPGLASALEVARKRPDVPVAATDQDNAELGEETPGSLIGTTLAQIIAEERRLRVVALDGVEPTFENFQRGAYPYAKPLHFVLGAKVNPLAQQFLAFLASPDGKQVLQQACVRL